MGGLSILRGLVGGLDQAAGNPDGAEQMQTLNQRDRTNKIAALRSQILPHSLAIQGLQTKLSALDPEKDADAYNSTVNDMQDHTHAIRDILYPDAKLGLSDWLQTHTTDRLHITSHDRRVRDLAAQNAQADAKGEGQDAATAAALAQGVVPYSETVAGRKEAADLALQDKRNAGIAGRATTTRPVPYYAGAVNRANALEAARAGKVYKDVDGNEIDLSKVPDGMFLLPIFAGGGKEYYELGTDKGRYETGNNQRLFERAVGPPDPNAPSIGAARVPTASSSVSTDSEGVPIATTNRISSPVAPGGTAGATAAPVGPKTQKLRSVQSGQSTPVQAGTVAPSQPSTAAPQLDADGHIPATDGSNAQLREAANRLLDGMDVDKLPIPQRDRAAAMQLASKFGWGGQGAFTPREKLQVAESQQLLQRMRSNPKTMAIFGQGPLKRGLIQHFITASGGEGIADNIKQALAGSALSQDDADFVQDMRNLIGRIQGLAQLTRGSGRPTEAAINRLVMELPNLNIASNPAQAQHALDLIQNEIDIAMKAGARVEGPKTKRLQDTKPLADRLNDALEGK